MTYMVLWRATDKPTLFESDEYETFKEAEAALIEFSKTYPWNTYLLVRIEQAKPATSENPTLPKIIAFLPPRS